MDEMSDAFWADRLAPSLDDLEALAKKAFGELPDAFRVMVGEVTFAVAEFPDDEALDELGLE